MKTNPLKPMLIDCLKGYNGQQLAKDVVAGIIVAIIALPLSIALALASGVGPEEGIYTAIVAGFLISLLGGSRVQIAGPTAAFATIVAGIVATNGMDGLMTATIIAGVLLILMGVFRVGSLIKFIPFTITTGFTAGIAVTIVIGQLKDFLGLTYPAGVRPVETMEKLEAVAANFGTVNVTAVLVGLISLAILIFWPKVTEKIPGSLIAVIAGILIVKLGGLKVNTIGDLYTISGGLPKLHLPQITLPILRDSLGNGFTIAILAAIESLLSCVVADGMIGDRHRSNAELVAQGVGNIGSALFGGIPATGAIARTAANIKNGGRTPVAGMVHALVLVLVLVLLMPYAALIPMPTIAAILFLVAWNMCGIKTFISLCKTSPVFDIIVLVAVFVLTVVFDLVVAIAVGMVLACVFFVKRMADETKVTSPEADVELPADVTAFSIHGPLFFGSADVLEQVKPAEGARALFLNMAGVPAVDASALKTLTALQSSCAAKGAALYLIGLQAQPAKLFEKNGFAAVIGAEHIAATAAEALETL